MAQTPIDLSRPWEHFPADNDEREMDQKMIKVIEGMPAEVQNRFKGMYMISNHCTCIGDQMDREMEELEAAFALRKEPLFAAREKIVLGETTDFAADVKTFDEAIPMLEAQAAKVKHSAEEQAEIDEANAAHEPVKVDHLEDVNGVPDFWLQAVKNNEMLMAIIKEKDTEVLESITKLSVSKVMNPEADVKCAKSITLSFGENEFITNSELTLTCSFKDTECEEIAKVASTVVDWKDGKDLSKKKVKKKQKHKKTGETRTVTKTVEADSMFNCFKTFTMPEIDEDSDADEPEAEDAKLLEQGQECMTLIEDLTTTYEEAVTYYLGYGMSMEEMMANAGYDPEQMAQMMGGAEGEDGMNMGGDDNSDEDGEAGGEGYVPQSKFGATNDMGKKKKK